MKSIYLSKNNETIRERLKASGFYICKCCEFPSNKYLNYYHRESIIPGGEDTDEIHGIGCPCENGCQGTEPKKCFMCSISDSIDHGHVVGVYNNVDDFIKAIELWKQ